MALRSPREGSNWYPTLGSRGGEEEGSISSSQSAQNCSPRACWRGLSQGNLFQQGLPIPFPHGLPGGCRSLAQPALQPTPQARPASHLPQEVPHSEAASLWQAWLGDMHTCRFLTPLWQAYVLGLMCCVLHRFWNFLNGLWLQSRTVKHVQKALRKLIIGHIHVNMCAL